MRGVQSGAPLFDLNEPLGREGLEGDEQGAGAAPLIFVIEVLGDTGTQGQGRAHLAQQLFGRFIQTHDGPRGIIRPRVNLQHILHSRHEVGVLGGGKAPHLL